MTFLKTQNNLVSSLISEKQGFKFILKFHGIYLQKICKIKLTYSLLLLKVKKSVIFKNKERLKNL